MAQRAFVKYCVRDDILLLECSAPTCGDRLLPTYVTPDLSHEESWKKKQKRTVYRQDGKRTKEKYALLAVTGRNSLAFNSSSVPSAGRTGEHRLGARY